MCYGSTQGKLLCYVHRPSRNHDRDGGLCHQVRGWAFAGGEFSLAQFSWVQHSVLGTGTQRWGRSRPCLPRDPRPKGNRHANKSTWKESLEMAWWEWGTCWGGGHIQSKKKTYWLRRSLSHMQIFNKQSLVQVFIMEIVKHMRKLSEYYTERWGTHPRASTVWPILWNLLASSPRLLPLPLFFWVLLEQIPSIISSRNPSVCYLQ